jgi:hypothetical protein
MQLRDPIPVSANVAETLMITLPEWHRKLNELRKKMRIFWQQKSILIESNLKGFGTFVRQASSLLRTDLLLPVCTHCHQL